MTQITPAGGGEPFYDFRIMLYFMENLSSDDAEGDALRKFPELNASQKWISNAEIGWVRPKDIVSHLAVCLVGEGPDAFGRLKVATLSLNQVGPS